jgi:hypothetical protein
LNVENVNKKANQYEYNLNGNDFGLNIFAGDYQVVNDKDIDYIIPKKYKMDFIETKLNDLSRLILEKSSTTESKFKSDILKNKSYKRVIVSDWYSNTMEKDLENEIQFFKDAIIINLGA